MRALAEGLQGCPHAILDARHVRGKRSHRFSRLAQGIPESDERFDNVRVRQGTLSHEVRALTLELRFEFHHDPLGGLPSDTRDFRQQCGLSARDRPHEHLDGRDRQDRQSALRTHARHGEQHAEQRELGLFGKTIERKVILTDVEMRAQRERLPDLHLAQKALEHRDAVPHALDLEENAFGANLAHGARKGADHARSVSRATWHRIETRHYRRVEAAEYAGNLMPNTSFRVRAPFQPSGDQPKAIAQLVEGLKKGNVHQTLLGVTGSGKTNVVGWVVENIQKPALVLSHNKTLAAQLAQEFKELFPENAVHYFVSYYDYYQPEAYVPQTDTYIQKDADINDEIDRLRHAATQAVLERDDVLVVASVSAIYGLGSPKDYVGQKVKLRRGLGHGEKGAVKTRSDVLRELTYALYVRNDVDFKRGTFRVRGDTVDVHPVGDETIIRLKFLGDALEGIERRDPLTGEVLARYAEIELYPATLYITPADRLRVAVQSIRLELEDRLRELTARGKLVEAQRLAQRTNYDLEMLETVGVVPGIENYSRHLDGRPPGDPPVTLLDLFVERFGKNFLTVVDESHVTLPQISGMSQGDRSRKQTLVAHGFRLPSALDNRPLRADEFAARLGPVIYASATPDLFERQMSQQTVELIVRPTGLLDPTIEIHPTEGQIDHLLDAIQERITHAQRVLVTTLTKRMAEDLAEYLGDLNVKVAYIHADVDTLDRIDLLQNLRRGTIDVLVGINLLREGLDLPEVSLVAILDADKEGYLRNETALIQVMGRAARHVRGHVILYADRITGSMKRAMEETERRRKVQEAFNAEHGITPKGIEKAIRKYAFRLKPEERAKQVAIRMNVLPEDIPHVLEELTAKMHLAAANLEFEEAARLRDQLTLLKGEERKRPRPKRSRR